MKRSVVSTAAVVLGTAMIMIAAPSVAMASAHPGTAPGVAASAQPLTLDWVFTGKIYPQTQIGLSQCQAEGAVYLSKGYVEFSCLLDDPDELVYNLWVAR